VKATDKWAEMKDTSPKLAIFILEGLVDECARKHLNQPSSPASSLGFGLITLLPYTKYACQQWNLFNKIYIKQCELILFLFQDSKQI
jgi:hypothetical protein